MASNANIKNLLGQLIPIWGLDRVAELIESDSKRLPKGKQYDKSRYLKALKNYQTPRNLQLLNDNHKSLTKALQRWLPTGPKVYGTKLPALLDKAVDIWGQPETAKRMKVSRETVTRWHSSGKLKTTENTEKIDKYTDALKRLLPAKPDDYDNRSFNFIDLFAGIGGLRMAFEGIGGKCVFTSEWDEFAQKTYMANHYDEHGINGNIKFFTEGGLLSKKEGRSVTELTEKEIEKDIRERIPSHDILLAGFPCQPFSIAGVSKKNSLGRAHGFDCKLQGTLFFDVCKILKAKKPACVLLENVKNLKSHNNGDTYQSILEALDDANYEVLNPRVINAKEFLPQNRERIVIVAFRKDLKIEDHLSLDAVRPNPDEVVSSLAEILERKPEDRYTLTPNLWEYLQAYKKKHREAGNGFGYQLVIPDSPYTRTLSARYHKDGSEILIARGKGHAKECEEGRGIPRRLMPKECARLMGFDRPGEESFVIPVSDTQAYRQFGNSVVVPVFNAVASLLETQLTTCLKNS
jgi:DNA (cytosine-5)-methyltransferase 1